LLAGLTSIKPDDRIVELGTGCGVVPMVLAYRKKSRHTIVGIEIQPELARLAHRSVEENRLGELIQIIEMDFRAVAAHFEPGSFDLLLSNPPYRKPGTGRINPNRQKAIARHELSATLADVFAAGDRLLSRGGRVALIYPATRIGHLMNAAHERGFSPKRLRIIHSRPGGPGRLVHVECSKGGGEEVRVEPPFYIYGEDGAYTEAMKKMYED